MFFGNRGNENGSWGFFLTRSIIIENMCTSFNPPQKTLLMNGNIFAQEKIHTINTPRTLKLPIHIHTTDNPIFLLFITYEIHFARQLSRWLTFCFESSFICARIFMSKRIYDPKSMAVITFDCADLKKIGANRNVDVIFVSFPTKWKSIAIVRSRTSTRLNMCKWRIFLNKISFT